MPNIDIFTESGEFENCILSSEEYAEATYPGRWKLSEFQPSPEPVNPVLQQITMRQCRIELYKRELLDDVEAVMYQATREQQIAWEYAAVVNRDDPIINMVQQMNDLTNAEIDDMFIEAAKL